MGAIGVAFLTWRRHHQKEVFPYGITLKQLYVLRQLERKGALYPSEIAEILFCDRPTATVVIKNMEKQGWVKRQTDPGDSRRIRVTLETAGRAKMVEIFRKQTDVQSESFDPLSCFTDEEKEQLDRLLTKLNQHLKQLRENTNSRLPTSDFGSLP